MKLRMTHATVGWLSLLLALLASPMYVYGVDSVSKRISPEVAAELTTFGDTLAQSLKFWSVKEQATANDCQELANYVWLGEFDAQSPLPKQVQEYIKVKHKELGVRWEYSPPCGGKAPFTDRIAIIARELAKAATNYEYALDLYRIGGRDSQSAVCVPGEKGEKCEFDLFNESSENERFLKRLKTLRLKSGLKRCDVKNNILGASCLHEQTTLVNLATFWHQAVNRATDVRLTSDEKYVPMSPHDEKRDVLFRADSKRRLTSFQRALLPYSQWIDPKGLIDGLTSLDLYSCEDQSGQESFNDVNDCLRQARDPYSSSSLEDGTEKLEILPELDICLDVEEPNDPNFSLCGLRRDFYAALRAAHLTAFFAQQLHAVQGNVSMQSDADRTQVLQLAMSTIQLSPAARSWLELDEVNMDLFSKANQAFGDTLKGDNGLAKRLEVSLESKNHADTDKNNPCTAVFDYNPYMADTAGKPPEQLSKQSYEKCMDWLKQSNTRLGEEVEFLHTVLPKQKEQYDAARAMLSDAVKAAEGINDLKGHSFAEYAAVGLYLKTRAAETADTLYQRLGSPTECKQEKKEASPSQLTLQDSKEAQEDIPCKLELPYIEKKTAPDTAMRLALQVLPAEEYDSTYNVSTRQLVEVRLTNNGCNEYSESCYIAESRTPATVSLVRGRENIEKITPIEYHDWGLKIINVRAQQSGPADCSLVSILRDPSELQGKGKLCRAGQLPMTLGDMKDDVEEWVWQRPSDPDQPRKWLSYLGSNSFVSADGIGVAWDADENELKMFGTFTATTLGSSEFEKFQLSLTHGSESDWRRIVRQTSLLAVLKALPAITDVYKQSNSVPSSLNLPEGMVFVALSLDSVEPIRLRLYAYPEGHPALVTAFSGALDRAGKLNWSSPRTLLSANFLLLTQTVDLEVIEELATIFTSTADIKRQRRERERNILGETLARRDLFETFFQDLESSSTDLRQITANTKSDPVNVQATFDQYQAYAQVLEQNPVSKLLGVWQKSLRNHREVLDTLRTRLEKDLKDKLVTPATILAKLEGKAREELLWFLGFSKWEEADQYVKEELDSLIIDTLQMFSATGGLYECWAAHQEKTGGDEIGRNGICSLPPEAVNRIGTQIAQRFVLGSHLNASEYGDAVKEFRARLNEPPAPLTTQKLLDSANEIRNSIKKDVEQSVKTAWDTMVVNISRNKGNVLAPMVKALNDETKSADLFAALAALQVNCKEVPFGCERVLVSLGAASLYPSDTAPLTSGLEPNLERILNTLIPLPDVVYGGSGAALTSDSQVITKTLRDARSDLTNVLQQAQRDQETAVGRAIEAVGLVVREKNAFIPPVVERDGALYLSINWPAWGGEEGDKLLGVDCQSDGTDCGTDLEDLKTSEDLQAALNETSLTSAPSPFIRVERAGRKLMLTLPRTADYLMGIVPNIPGLDPAQIADIEQLVDNVDPRDQKSLQEKIRRAELKHTVLTTTIGRLNEAVPFDWPTVYQEETEAFEKACKGATRAKILFGESSCDNPVELFHKATNLDLRQISDKLIKNIADSTIPLPRPSCTPNSKVHKVLQGAAKAACNELATQVGRVEDQIKSNNLKAAREHVAAMPHAVTAAFGDAFADATQEGVLKTMMNVASAAELLPLQQTVFEYKAHTERICTKALESSGGGIQGCESLKQRFIDALDLDLQRIANEQVEQAINRTCVEVVKEIGLGNVNNCNGLQRELNHEVVGKAQTLLEKFEIVRPGCTPRNEVSPILKTAAQNTCNMLSVQLDAVESAVHQAHFQRAQKLTADLPRVAAEAFGDSLKQQAESFIRSTADEAQQAAQVATDQALNELTPYWEEIQQYEQRANYVCVNMRDRVAEILGDELPKVDGCKGVDALLDPNVIDDLVDKRRKKLEDAVRDHVESELKAKAKPLIDAAHAVYNEQKKLLKDVAEAKGGHVLAELRETESRVCSAIDKLFGGGSSVELTIIPGAPFTIRRSTDAGALCVPEDLSLKAEMNLLGQTVEVIGGLSLNMEQLRRDVLLDELEKGRFNPAILVDLNWRKFRTKPSLKFVLTKKLQSLDDGLSLHRLEAQADKILIGLQYQPAAFPFAVPVNTEISTKGVKVELGELGEVLTQAVCNEISEYILLEQPEILPDTRIVRAPPEYCTKRKLKGLEFRVAVDLAESLGRVDVQVFIDSETGLRIVPPNLKQLAVGQLLKLFGIDAVRPVAPFYDTTDGLTLYLEGNADTPLGLALQAGFSISPHRLKLRGPIGLRIPGWYDTNIVSLGDLGITYNPENKELSLLGALTIVPGEAMNQLVRVDGRGSLGIEEKKLEVTGNLVVLRLLGVAGTRTTIILPERLFEHTIGTSPMLADIVKLQGDLRIQDLKPNPFLAASGEGGIFGADIATMEVELQRNFGGHFDAGLKIPLDESAMTFNVVVEENMGDVTAGTKATISVGPVKPTFSMDADKDSVGVGLKVDLKEIGSLDIGFALPSFASLTPEYVLSLLLDMGLTFHVPSSLASIANDAPEGYSGAKSGSGGKAQGREADNEPPNNDKEYSPPGDYKRAWRMVPVEYCKPFKIGFKLWCEKRIRWEPAFVEGRGGSMAKQAGYSASSAKHYDVHYDTSIGNYDLLVGTKNGDKRAYVFAKNGGKLWGGSYKISHFSKLNSKPYAHKSRQGKNILVVKTGGEYFGIKPNEILDTDKPENKLKGAEAWLKESKTSEFARRLLPSVAEEQLYNKCTVEQNPIGRSDKWVLLNIIRSGDSSASKHILVQTRDASEPLTFISLSDLNKGDGNTTENLVRHLKALKEELPDELDQVCLSQDPAVNAELSLDSPCAFLAVGQRTADNPVAFGLDDTLSDQPTAFLATKKKAWVVPVQWPRRFSAASLNDVNPSMLLNLVDSLARNPDQLDGMTELTNAVVDLSGNGRIAVVGNQKNQEYILFSPRNIQVDHNGTPIYFSPRRLNMACVEEFWEGKGSLLRPFEETLRARGVSKKDALILSLIHHDVFKSYGFAADPVGSLYKYCGN